MTGKRHDATGRTGTLPASSRQRKANRRPEDQPWIWLTREMLESPAWRALSENGRRLIDRVMLEHMAHGGAENGNLIVTYADLQAWGVRLNSIAPTISECVGLGWITHQKGERAHGDGRGHAQRFGLSWLPTTDGEPAVHGWRALVDRDAAEAVAKAARASGADGRRKLKAALPPKI